MRAPLHTFAGRLRDDPALTQILGRSHATLATPQAARAATIAAMTELSSRRPLIIAVPTGTDAARLTDDLTQFIDDVELFPAWETLPFERVSPSVETMGRRLRVLHRLRVGNAPTIIVAGIRALAQQLGPHVEDVEPISVAPGATIDPAALAAHLVMAGYRREELVEHRGEVSLRGSIVDVFPSTSDQPVRIDCWGDEVDRLTNFSVSDQRSTDPIESITIYPARELLPTDEVRSRAAELIRTEPWGREQWERLSEGTFFDGMESWLPWLTTGEHLLTDILPEGAQLVLVEPQRLRDRADDVNAEEADLARTLAVTWGADQATFPRLHVPSERLLASDSAARLPTLTLLGSPDRPDTPAMATGLWAPVAGGGEALVKRLKTLSGRGFTIVVAADTEGSRARMRNLLGDAGIDLRPDQFINAPLHEGAIFEAAKLAILAESDLTGRRRSHRAPRPKKRAAAGFFEDLKPGDFIVHYHHGVGRYAGMVKRTIGGVERDYLLLEYRGADKLYVPSDQIDAVRHYVGGETPTLHRMGGSDFAAAKSRVRGAVREVAQELCWWRCCRCCRPR